MHPLRCRLWASVGPTTVAFSVGAVGVVAGTLLGWALLGAQLGAEGAKVQAGGPRSCTLASWEHH